MRTNTPFTAARAPRTRRGGALIWVVVSQVLLLTVSALAIDAGLLHVVKADLQAAADASALAAASGLADGPDTARGRAVEYAAKNRANGEPVSITDADIELGNWNYATRQFELLAPSDEELADAVRVTARLTEDEGNAVNLVFAPIFGQNTSNVGASAIAAYQPRDIVLVIDLSGSMNDDSEIKQIGDLGRDAIEDNLYQIWHELGAPTFGNMQFEPVYISSNNTSTIRQMLGLNGVAYPYPSGNWNNYINYVRNSSVLDDYGYRKKYGYLTLVNYWLEQKSLHTETPDLWQVSAQPITAVKNAVDVFLDYIREIATNDRVGLSVYTYSDGDAHLESPLTTNLDHIQTLTRQRQAGHYDDLTNIGAGMRTARLELDANGRTGAQKVMVLLTDGIANRPSNASYARQFAIQEAHAAKAARIPVVAISLGANADTNLMNQIATISEGVHFNIPGGQTVDQYEEDLIDVFRQIAAHRPLRLVR